MTRSRAVGPGNSPTGLMVEYKARRATPRLVITEGTQPSVTGHGYRTTSGLHSAEQVAACRTVTDAVHAKGGRIFVRTPA